MKLILQKNEDEKWGPDMANWRQDEQDEQDKAEVTSYEFLENPLCVA
ncbi:MAG: hypothetical protein WCO56_15725 [Verrucomicrobiota bacterium]